MGKANLEATSTENGIWVSALAARARIYDTTSIKKRRYLRGPCPPETGGGIIGGGRGNRGIPIIGGSGLGPYADMGGGGGGP